MYCSKCNVSNVNMAVSGTDYALDNKPSPLGYIFGVLLTLLLIPITVIVFVIVPLYSLPSKTSIQNLVNSIDFTKIDDLDDEFSIDDDSAAYKLLEEDYLQEFISDKMGTFIYAVFNGDNVDFFEEDELVNFVKNHEDDFEKIKGSEISDSDWDKLKDTEEEINSAFNRDFTSELSDTINSFNYIKIGTYILIGVYVGIILLIMVCYHKRIRNAFISYIIPHIFAALVCFGISTVKFFSEDNFDSIATKETTDAFLNWFFDKYYNSGLVAIAIIILCVILAVIFSVIMKKKQDNLQF